MWQWSQMEEVLHQQLGVTAPKSRPFQDEASH
jgi:hypothetical protein